ncbi:MAG: aspartate/glutamate racemase family protein [Granulosicoccus sp.]
MQILLLNPNMTAAMTIGMAKVARTVASDSVDIVTSTATKGFPYISSRAEALIAGSIVLETIAEHERTADGVIIAAFGDPGLKAAQEQFNLPIVGMAQASIVTASLLGERFSIVTFTPLMSRWYLDSVLDSGLTDRFLGVKTPEAGKLDAFADQSSMETELLSLINKTIDDDGADVVILGGAPLAGMAMRLQSEVDALLLDPISSAISLLESLVRVSDKNAFSRRHSRPVKKTSTGLPEVLARSMSIAVTD